MFTWKPIYKELAELLLKFQSHSSELLAILKEIKDSGMTVMPLMDKDAAGHPVALTEIDPFTFFATFNRYIPEKMRLQILDHLKKRLSLQSDLPVDFDGVPLMSNTNSWFFSYAAERQPDDILSLWNLAVAAMNGGPQDLDATMFARCLQVKQVGVSKLTAGLFWLNPNQYIAVDGTSRAYFKTKGIETEVYDLSDYKKLIEDVDPKLGHDYTRISVDAFTETTKGKKYWAGGFLWGGQDSRAEDRKDKRAEFIANNYWQTGYSKNAVDKAAKRCWAFFKKIKIGDEFAIKGYGGQNDLVIHYIGIVAGKDATTGRVLLQRQDRSLYRDKTPGGSGSGNWRETLVPVTRPDIIKLLFRSDPPVGLPNLDSKTIERKTSLSGDLNLILYGPPGTGKTYSTIKRAVEIIDGNTGLDQSALKNRWDQLTGEGRIGFITFHQSYTYEDFVEGIRPVLTEDGTDLPRYDCRNGVFKDLALRAFYEYLVPVVGTSAIPTFNLLWQRLIAQIDAEPEREYNGLTPATSFLLEESARGNVKGQNVKSNVEYTVSPNLMESLFAALRPNKTITTTEVLRTVGRGCHASIVAALFNELKRIEANSPADAMAAKPTTDAEKISVVQSYLALNEKSGYRVDRNANPDRYVLVIDEINRGNISKILGELITLVEDDKRVPGENALTVILPYSHDRFAVPANLHLLGTLNTTDKSIALVDLALRRRFSFEELTPDFTHCTGLTVEMRSVLKGLNLRITMRKDRDHQIGHAYFMTVSDSASFNAVFRRKIIPLLQEYFYSDWEGLRFVLGESDQNAVFIRKIPESAMREARTKWQWYYDDGTSLDALATLNSAYGRSSATNG